MKKCEKCSEELEGEAIFCGKCGTPTNKEDVSSEKKGQETEQEQLVNVISGIKYSGIASIVYWTILFSNEAIYFCNMGSNALPLGFGVISDIYLSHKTKGDKQNLEEMLNKSEKYYKIKKASFDNLKHEKGLFGGSVFFPKEDGKIMKLKLGGKQYEQFINNLDTI
jgi:uncharacterized membrane protein YvbJ